MEARKYLHYLFSEGNNNKKTVDEMFESMPIYLK